MGWFSSSSVQAEDERDRENVAYWARVRAEEAAGRERAARAAAAAAEEED